MNLKKILQTTPIISIPYKLYHSIREKRRIDQNTEHHLIRFGGNEVKPIYIIRRTHKAGFFSNFFYVLGHIIDADNKGYDICVDMQNYQTLYNEKRAYKKTNNAWEYYFMQPSRISLKQAYKSKNIILSDGKYRYDFVPYYEGLCSKFPTVDIVEGLIPYIDKYIHFNSEIINEADQLFESFGKCRMLGVHIRGTDMKSTPNHPIPPTVEQYLLHIYELVEADAVDKIFLCTDEEKTIEIMKQHFGDRIICTNAFRSNDGKSIHKGHSKESRKFHKFLLGKEVLLDSLLLSKCDFLCCGHSNVPYAAIVFNRNAYKGIFVIENEEQNKNMLNEDDDDE